MLVPGVWTSETRHEQDFPKREAGRRVVAMLEPAGEVIRRVTAGNAVAEAQLAALQNGVFRVGRGILTAPALPDEAVLEKSCPLLTPRASYPSSGCPPCER